MKEQEVFTAEQFVEKSLNQFLGHLTENVLVMIQSDRGLMQEYLDLVRVQDSRRLNRLIGRLIDENFRFDEFSPSGRAARGVSNER